MVLTLAVSLGKSGGRSASVGLELIGGGNRSAGEFGRLESCHEARVSVHMPCRPSE